LVTFSASFSVPPKRSRCRAVGIEVSSRLEVRGVGVRVRRVSSIFVSPRRPDRLQADTVSYPVHTGRLSSAGKAAITGM
jgi:hypothetical protein